MAATRRTLIKRTLQILAVLAAAGLAFVVVYILPTASGYAAKNACSSVFVAGLSEERISAEELKAVPYASFSVDRENKRVRASVVGLAARTAVFREGLGCAVAVDVEPDSLTDFAFEPPAAQLDEAPWPRGNRADDRPDPPGLDRAGLDAAVAAAFDEPDPDSLRHTRAVVVVQGGRLLAERYAADIDASTPLLGWSMTKSVTGAMVGILVGRGELDPAAPAPVPQWRNDARKDVTLDQLLRMSSGLEFEEVYGPLTDATHMLFEVDDAAAIALAKPLAKPPDSEFSYSSGTTNILSWIVRQRFATVGEYHRFPYESLFAPLGMSSATMETDASGTFVGSSFLYATARDWARFGELYLRDGMWRGQRILPEGWAAYSGAATPTAKRGEYAAQFWANAGAKDDPSDRKLPHVPTDAFWASGFQGQAVLIVPSRDAVLVRLGLTHDRAAWDLDAFASSVLATLPPTSGAGT
ncbi:MAG: serine hydrolase [Myxococcota bacterium]